MKKVTVINYNLAAFQVWCLLGEDIIRVNEIKEHAELCMCHVFEYIRNHKLENSPNFFILIGSCLTSTHEHTDTMP